MCYNLELADILYVIMFISCILVYIFHMESLTLKALNFYEILGDRSFFFNSKSY